MGAEYGVTIWCDEHQAVGDDRQVVEAGAREDPRDGVVETVADDVQHDVTLTAKGDEAGETGIDVDGVEKPIEGGTAASQERDLTSHAVGGADEARPPLRFDIVPARRCESLEQNVGDIAGRNRSVEVANYSMPHIHDPLADVSPFKHGKTRAMRLWRQRSRAIAELLRRVAAFLQFASSRIWCSPREMSERWNFGDRSSRSLEASKTWERRGGW